MEIILVRHADPNYKLNAITELGHAQAKALGQKIRNTEVDFLYVSPEGRAQDTCHYIAEALNMNPVTLEWLKEIGDGFMDGYAAWERPGDDYLQKGIFPPPDRWWEGFKPGEEMMPYYRAIVEGFDNLLRGHGYSKAMNLYQIDRPNRDVICLVSHKGTILTLLGYLLHWTLPLVYIHSQIDVASITKLSWKEIGERYAVPKLAVLNDTSHLF